MMVCRRRWRLLALTLVAFTPALAHAATAGGVTLPHTPEDLKTKHGREATNVRDDLIKGAPSEDRVQERNDYAREVGTRFRGLLTDENADARLNTAILFGRLQTLSTDRFLIECLANADPSVRYWGAKGLGDKVNLVIKRAKAEGPVIKALRDAAKAETVGVVQREILRSLVVYESLDGVLDGLERITDTMRGEIPDRGALNAAADGFNWLQGVIGSATAAQKTRAATIAARAASFTAQQHEAFAKFPPVPAPWADSAKQAVTNAVEVLNKATGNSFRIADMSSPDLMILGVNSLVGKPGAPGKLQGATNPPIPVPPRIGGGATTAASQPGAAPTQPSTNQ
jgi:hypothetical protein